VKAKYMSQLYHWQRSRHIDKRFEVQRPSHGAFRAQIRKHLHPNCVLGITSCKMRDDVGRGAKLDERRDQQQVALGR